jgi:predicted dehydrogenase
VALCDPNKDITRARDFTGDRAEGVYLYRDDDKFLAHPGMDAVVICSPDRFHAQQLLKAVTAGKHVLVDKPAAATRDDLKLLNDAFSIAWAKGLVVSSCHPRRFNPAYVQIKERMEGWMKAFGALLRLEMDFSYHVPDPERAGLHTGMLADHLNHEADFMRFLLGRSTTAFRRLLDSADRYEMSGIRDADKVAFHFSGTRRLVNKVYPEIVRLRFERGDITVSTADGAITERDHDRGCSALASGKPTDYEAAFDGIMTDFRDAIRDGKIPNLHYEDVVLNSRLCVDLTERADAYEFC